MLQEILDILVPIYALILLAYVLGRLGFPWPSKEITPALLQIALPALIIRELANDHADPDDLLRMMLAAALVLAISTLIFWGLIRWRKLSVRTYLAPAALSSPSIGLAVGMLGFGDSGLSLALGYGGILLVGQFSLGCWLLNGKVQWLQLVKQAFLWGFILALVLMFLKVDIPSYIDKTLEIAGNLAIPILILSLGFALTKVNFNGFGRMILYSGIRSLVIIGLSIAAAYGLGFDQSSEAFKLVLLMGVLPAATINILMGMQAEDDMQPITLFVFCTTLWTAILLPIAMVILL